MTLSALAEPLDSAAVRSVLLDYAPHASHPIPVLSDAQLDRLLEGRVVKLRTPSEGRAPDGAMAMVITDHSRVDLWLGSIDSEHFGTDSSLISHHLPLRGEELFRWYGYVALPAPVTDRHFLIQTTINPTLPQQRAGMWERSWGLEAGLVETMRPVVAAGEIAGLSLEAFDAAISVPVNLGAWIFLDLPDGRTVFGYHCASSLGGEIPDALVTRYVFWGLDRLVERVLESARQMPTHYTIDHAPLIGGDGVPIPRH
ncbi:MAG: hypothetical protein P8R54_12465 [Myxococcota bacterium]|nr:hypothetical protein [Myxococcota bacterium]